MLDKQNMLEDLLEQNYKKYLVKKRVYGCYCEVISTVDKQSASSTNYAREKEKSFMISQEEVVK